MKGKRYIALAIVLAMLLTLSGCGMKNEQQKAIEEMIINYTDYYIEVPDLGQQIHRQARALTGYEDAAAYTLNVRIPDYSLIPIGQVRYEAPPVDYSNPGGEAYLEDFREAIGVAMQQYAIETPLDGSVESTLTIKLSKDADGAWTASPDKASLSALENLISGMLTKKASEIKELPEEYDFACVAEQANALLGSLIGEGGYTDAIQVTNVEALGGDQYRISFDYPDPAAAFATLGDAFLEAYAESATERIFEPVECTLNPDDYAPAAAVSAKSGSITVTKDGEGVCTIADGTAFSEEIAAALSAAESDASGRVYEQFGVPEVARPVTSQILSGSATGSYSLEFRMTSVVPDTYIRLYRVNSSVKEAGTFVVSYFATSGSRYNVSLAAGKYKVLLAWGDTWYGQDFMFGPKGKYYYFDFVVDIDGDIYFPTTKVWSWYNDILKMDYDADLTIS